MEINIDEAIKVLQENGFSIWHPEHFYLHKYIDYRGNVKYTLSRVKEEKVRSQVKAYWSRIDFSKVNWTKYKDEEIKIEENDDKEKAK